MFLVVQQPVQPLVCSSFALNTTSGPNELCRHGIVGSQHKWKPLRKCLDFTFAWVWLLSRETVGALKKVVLRRSHAQVTSQTHEPDTLEVRKSVRQDKKTFQRGSEQLHWIDPSCNIRSYQCADNFAIQLALRYTCSSKHNSQQVRTIPVISAELLHRTAWFCADTSSCWHR